MLSLTFAIDTLKPSGPLAGLSGLSSMSLIGGVPLVGEFGEAPEIPKAGPAWTFAEPALGDDAGWWLQLVSKDEMGTGRWPQVQISDESPVSNSLDTTINYDTSQEWRWSSWLGAATANFISESQWAYAGAWSELMSAQPSADPYYLGARNPKVQVPGNPWEGDFLKAFDDYLMARIRNEAMGNANLPLLAGDVPLYGMDGNQTGSAALTQASVMIGQLGQHIARSAGLGPIERLLAGDFDNAILEAGNLVPGVNALASGDYLGLALEVLPMIVMPFANRLAAAFRVSKLATPLKLAINFTTGAAVHAGADILKQMNAISRGEQKEYDLGRTLIAGTLGGLTNAMTANTCFTGDTPLLVTETESKPIKDFKSYAEHGDDCDWILTRDEHDATAPLVRKRVLHRFIRVSPILNLHIQGRIIQTTAEHPFYVLSRSNSDGLEGWLPAGFLQASDVLVSHDGQVLTVEGIADSGEVTTVYNLEIEECHTYFVGSPDWGFSIWAHNADKTYSTYTKTHEKTGKVYGGRVSGTGTPAQHLARRDKNHHMNKKGYGPAVLDQSSPDKGTIRGREQQLIDHFGGAQSTGGTSGNAINGIRANHPERKQFLDASTNLFGNL